MAGLRKRRARAGRRAGRGLSQGVGRVRRVPGWKANWQMWKPGLQRSWVGRLFSEDTRRAGSIGRIRQGAAICGLWGGGVTTFFVLVLLVVLGPPVLRLVLRKTKGPRGEWKVAAAINSTGLEALHDVILPDGRGGLTQVDHLIKTPVGIAVIETKNYSGKIFGGEREPTWTQVLGRKSFRFQNPLRQNFCHVEAVRALVAPGTDVMGHVIFVGDARFREMPAGVSGLGDFLRNLRRVRGVPVPAHVEAGWSAVYAAARRDRTARQAHRRQVTRRH